MDHSKLVQFIREKGYGLYQIPNNIAPSFEEMQKMGPVKSLEIGEHTYFFAPIPSQNRTLREEYSLTKGLGPSLIISPPYEGLLQLYKGSSSCENDNEIFFSRLCLGEEDQTVLMIPKTKYCPDPSAALLETRLLSKIFQNNFRIVDPKDYGKQVPILPVQDYKHN